MFKSNCSNNKQGNKFKPGEVVQTCYSSTGKLRQNDGGFEASLGCLWRLSFTLFLQSKNSDSSSSSNNNKRQTKI